MYHSKCELNTTKPVGKGLEEYFRPYTLDVTKMTSNSCEFDPTIIDTLKTYNDANCSKCESGNIMKFTNDGKAECFNCPDDTYFDRSTEIKRGVDQTCKTCPAGRYLKKGVSLSIFDSLPSNMQYLKFSTTCLTFDKSGKEVKCTDSKGFSTLYMTGMVAGEREAVNTLITMTIDLTILRDENKLYTD